MEVLTTWQRHLAGDIRVDSQKINIQNSLSELRMFHLKRSQTRQQLIAVVSLQIQDLIGFLNFKNTMTSNQILDTAEFIVDFYDCFSLMGIQHCFNLIKRSAKPFDKELYQSISGKKILEFLKTYDAYTDDYLFQKAKQKVSHDDFRALERSSHDNQLQKIGNLAESFKEIKRNFKK